MSGSMNIKVISQERLGSYIQRQTQTYSSKTVEHIMSTLQDMLMTYLSFPKIL